MRVRSAAYASDVVTASSPGGVGGLTTSNAEECSLARVRFTISPGDTDPIAADWTWYAYPVLLGQHLDECAVSVASLRVGRRVPLRPRLLHPRGHADGGGLAAGPRVRHRSGGLSPPDQGGAPPFAITPTQALSGPGPGSAPTSYPVGKVTDAVWSELGVPDDSADGTGSYLVVGTLGQGTWRGELTW